MTTDLNTFASWLFNVLTTIWNFTINNPLLKWVMGIYILNVIWKEFKKYVGK